MLSNRRGHRSHRRWTTAVLAVLGTTVAMLAAAPAVWAAAGPAVTRVAPSFGPLAGGTKVTVSGHNFAHVHAVTFGGTNGRSLDVLSSTKLTVRVPAHSAGTVDVRVHARAGTSPAAVVARYAYTNKGLIGGTVTAKSGGKPLKNVDVVAFDHGEYVTETLTQPDGSYLIRKLTASRHYVICFDATIAKPGSATGYADECYQRLPWNGRLGSVPEGVTEIPVDQGRAVTGIDAALPTAAGISGTVIAADDSSPVASVRVTAIYPGSADVASFAHTDENGQYTLRGLRQRAAGYLVCFVGEFGSGGPSEAGYLDQCYDSTAWDGSVFDVPPDASAAPATAGVVTPNIDAALDTAAGLDGFVTATSDGSPLSGVRVELFRVEDASVAAVTHTNDGGFYLFGGLPPGGMYDLCFDPTGVTAPSAGGYLPECYDDQPWDAGTVPGAAETVQLAPGVVTEFVDADLASAGGIAGHLTESGGSPLTGVLVSFHRGAQFVTNALTDANGDYRVIGLAPSDAYQVCFDGAGAFGPDGNPVPNLSDECYDDVTWDGSTPPPLDAIDIEPPAGDVISGIDAELDA